jgi:hypothetical protein
MTESSGLVLRVNESQIRGRGFGSHRILDGVSEKPGINIEKKNNKDSRMGHNNTNNI